MSHPQTTLANATSRQLQIALVARAVDRGQRALEAARATVAALEAKQSARIAEMARQIRLEITK